MARSLRGTAALLALGLAASLAAARMNAQRQGGPQPAQQPATPPTFRTGINLVRVDVLVTDRNGQAALDLRQDDFEITESGKLQTVDNFKLVRLDGGVAAAREGPPRPIRSDSDEEMEASRDDVRLFDIFLDDYHVRLLNAAAMRAPLASFIENELGPSDMVGVMYPLESVLSVRMTRNHAALANAVRGFVGRKYDYTPRNDVEERYSRL